MSFISLHGCQVLINFRFLDDGHTAWYFIHKLFPDRNSIPLDVQKSSSWLLFHQAMYHTYSHVDADGYATWTQILEGMKFWVFVRPRGYQDLKSRNEIHRESLQYLSATAAENGFYGEDSERYVIYASEGDMMQVFFSFSLSIGLVYTSFLQFSTTCLFSRGLYPSALRRSWRAFLYI